MYRLIIVDDNMYERNGIRQSVDWEKLGVEVVGVFGSGTEVLENMEALQPHIVIADIAMPMMSGIELATEIKKTHPHTRIIFISCHSDFEFARSAVDLGVYRYVMKPILSDELTVALEKLLEQIKREERLNREKDGMKRQIRDMMPFVQEQLFRELLLGSLSDMEDIKERFSYLDIPWAEDETYHVVYMEIHDAQNSHDAKEAEGRPLPASGAERAYLEAYTVKGLVKGLGSKGLALFPVQMSANSYAVIVLKAGDILEVVSNLALTLGNEAGLNATMGISKPSQEPSRAPKLYSQARKAVKTRFYSQGNPIIGYWEIEDAADEPREIITELESVYDEIKLILSEGDEDEIQEFIKKHLYSRRLGNEANAKAFVFSLINITGIVLMSYNKSYKDIFGDEVVIWKKLNRFETIADVDRWLFNIFKSIRENLMEKTSSRPAKIAEVIKEIIHTRYHQPLTIEDISRSVYISGRHANNLFKKETGKTIFDYLVEYRIAMAKKLLMDKDSKVAAVAESVGYVNTSYFCLAFKKYTGMTPAEYKNAR